MAAFPSYGELLLDSFSETPQSALNRTEMESGPVKQANVRSKELVAFNATYRYTSAELITWKAWRKNDLAFGSFFFDWVNPLTGNTVQARILGGLYNAIPFDGGDALKWDVSFTLETYE